MTHQNMLDPDLWRQMHRMQQVLIPQTEGARSWEGQRHLFWLVGQHVSQAPVHGLRAAEAAPGEQQQLRPGGPDQAQRPLRPCAQAAKRKESPYNSDCRRTWQSAPLPQAQQW